MVRNYWLPLTVGALVVGILWPQLPYFHSPANEFTLSLILIFAIIGVGLTMLLGWSGQVSLGHFALVGIGAYLTVHWAPDHWSLPALVLVVGVVCALAMVIVGLPALRVPGLTLAVTTLGFAVIAEDWVYHQAWLGSSSPFGLTLTSLPWGPELGSAGSQLSVYYVGLGVLTLAIGAGVALRRSVPGRTIVAVRDNERASAAFGVTPATVKLAILAISGFLAGTAGVLWAEAWKSISPEQFTADLSLGIIAIPVIGGLGSLGGAAAAAVLLYGSTFFVGPHLDSLFGNFGQSQAFGLVLAGVGQITVLLQLPTGLAGLAQTVWQRYLDRRAERHGPVAPKLVADPVSAVALSPEPSGVAVRLSVTETAEPALEVSGVRVHFGGILALDHPDVCVGAGEVVGLIGTNGAGKSTLMNVISGFVPPDGGSVKVFGHEVVDLPPQFRSAYRVARSFQDANVFVGLTVRETIQVALGGRNKVGMIAALFAAPWVRLTERRTEREALVTMERFGLTPWADVRTSALSTGTRRICDLAAQVTSRPKLLLLDEPTAGVAQREAEAFGPLLRRIRDELDCAILIVEHDMPLLMGLCDRIYALEAGVVIAEGTPEQIRQNPRVVASYLGTREAAISRSGATGNTVGGR
jgi:ABC-type branched-subunit amino acid transport system ATPase component/ABC-type branched-subunit amino acid transport system permease subunit